MGLLTRSCSCQEHSERAQIFKKTVCQVIPFLFSQSRLTDNHLLHYYGSHHRPDTLFPLLLFALYSDSVDSEFAFQPAVYDGPVLRSAWSEPCTRDRTLLVFIHIHPSSICYLFTFSSLPSGRQRLQNSGFS